jgi:hypothetical protein
MLPIRGGVVSLKDLVPIELYETCGFGQRRGLEVGRGRFTDSPFLRFPVPRFLPVAPVLVEGALNT